MQLMGLDLAAADVLERRTSQETEYYSVSGCPFANGTPVKGIKRWKNASLCNNGIIRQRGHIVVRTSNES